MNALSAAVEVKPLAPDLFAREAAAVASARVTLADDDASADDYRASLETLTEEFERLMRETRRLIGRSDRAEREMNALNIQLQTLARQLEFRATHDALTGVYNRGAVIERASQVLQIRDTSMIVLDIDHFKRINDDLGHPAGDAVLQGIVACLRTIVGDAGILGRVGGEEFTVVLPGADRAAALDMAERMRAHIEAHGCSGVVDRVVTASFGISVNAAGTDFDTAYGLADTALYAAKREGRNRVVAA